MGQLAVSDLVGARSIEVSSSASDANAYGGAQPWHVPYAALDGDPATSWRSDPAVSSEHARWTLHLSENRSVKGLQVRFDSVGGRRPTQVKISGQGGAALVDVPTDDRAVSVSLAGTTNWLRIETAAAKGSGPGALGLAEVTLPGLSVRRTLRTVPTPRGAATSAVVLDVADGARDACYELLLNWLCSEDVARPGEEDEGIDRTLALGKTSTFSLSAQVRAVPGKALDDLLQRGNPVAVTASSSAVGDPEGRPPVVLDGDLGTGWRAAPGDKDPSLHVAWSTPQRLSGLRLLIDPSLAVSRARSVEVVSVDGTRSGKVDALGLVTFPDLTTRAITVHLRRPAVAVTVNPYTTQSALLPVGLSELDVIGLSLRGSGPTRFVLPCGRAPDITIDRQVVHTAVTITRPQLLGLARVPLRICSSEAVTAGPGSRVVSRASQLLRPVALTMTGSIATAAPTMPVTTRRWQATLRQVGVPARDEPMLLRVHENTNPGWVASLAGKSLRPVVLDGWQQGWLVPAGPAGTVSLTYAPDVLYRRALLFGALAALFLLALALRGGAGASEASGPRAAGAVSIVVGLGAVLLVGGLTAAGACLLVLLLGLLLRRRSGWQSVAAPGLLGAAGLLLARQPWTSSHYAGHGYAAQALCVTALAVTWSALPVGGRSGTSRRKRMAGRSSTR